VDYGVRGKPDYDPTDKYKAGSKILIRLKWLIRVQEPVLLMGSNNVYRFSRPELYKDGVLVPYRKYAQEAINRLAGKTYRNFIGSVPPPVEVKPNQTLNGGILLDDFYDPLPPGHYQFTYRHKLSDGDSSDIISSNTITFDVVP
jgi:hypothetical protein